MPFDPAAYRALCSTAIAGRSLSADRTAQAARFSRGEPARDTGNNLSHSFSFCLRPAQGARAKL